MDPLLSCVGLAIGITRRVQTLCVIVLSSSYQADYEKQYYRPDEGNQDRLQVDPRHIAEMQQIDRNPASQQPAHHTDDDVANQPIASTFNDQSGQKTSDQTNHNPG
jgi:hypothetical protein